MKQWKKHINKDMVKIILTLAWPTMLEQLLQTAVQYIDTAMVGTFICYLRGTWNPLGRQTSLETQAE